MLTRSSPKLVFAPFRVAVFLSVMLLSNCQSALSDSPETSLTAKQADRLLYDRCEDCHNDYIFDGNWSISDINVNDIAQGDNLARWESILKSVAMGDMPPADKKQLTPQEKASLLHWLGSSLDNFAEQHPNPGRSTLRRLNRSEYANSVRDLLALDVDITPSLPGDDSGYGFDNNADVLSVSTTHLERYLNIAGKVSNLAIGIVPDSATKVSYVVPKDGSVKNSGVPSYDLRMSDDLPLDSRGGGSFTFYAPITGEYDIAGYLNANTNNEVDRLDIHRYNYTLTLNAGSHTIGMAFRKQLALNEHVPTVRKGTDYVVLPDRPPTELTLDFIVDGARVNTVQVPSYHLSSRFSQAAFLRDVMEIEVIGPLASNATITAATDTPSTRKIFICQPENTDSTAATSPTEIACAKRILTKLTTEAYRRPSTPDDIEPLISVFTYARKDLDFKASMATALQALLVSPGFFYLQEPAPQNIDPGAVYQISDTEFAARLALFLWSSIPDRTLRELAQSGRLREPEILNNEIERMLRSDKALALTRNFAGQWLYLRNLPYHAPDVFEFPQYNVPLQQSMKRETELFFTRILQDDRSIFDFLNADYGYLNEQLATHYGIEGVNGQAFRQVNLTEYSDRGGLLGQASILTLTSNPNHTSPVKRGKWILDNLLAASPPPPPPDVPALVAEHDGIALSAREQLKRHREDPVCAACHKRMDPLGLALEQYDAVGAFRTEYAGQRIDVTAQMPDGTQFEGLPGLHDILWERRERFALAFTERLLTYALGRGLEAHDQPTIRHIVTTAKADDYRIQSIVKAVIASMPFNYKKAPEAPDEKEQIATAH
ncbi:DUF1592 domain-containing protein [Aestuariibacter sp. GS-14]|uniref:DUF1592 domain-containing protein n=1 Tax=Aestuariibacter sp. GS-14 TaxID=2590670 RepID=UPI001C63DD34|nr:DUF1592 domain-containing protein [Aestuariibacter sp. GS-14]